MSSKYQSMSKLIKSSNRNYNYRLKRNIYQLRIAVDITPYYSKFDQFTRQALSTYFGTNLMTRFNGTRVCLLLTAHPDSTNVVRCFGSKTHQIHQDNMKKFVFTENLRYGKDRWYGISDKKVKALDCIGYSNYCLVTPGGVFNAMSTDNRIRNYFGQWISFFRSLNFIGHFGYPIRNNQAMTHKISPPGVSKVYYNEIDKKMHVKLLVSSGFSLLFADRNAPAPFKQTYYHTFVTNKFRRVIDSIITDPKAMIDINDSNDSDDDDINMEKKYRDKLLQWQGFIRVSIDVTDQFNQFHQRLRDEWEIKRDDGYDVYCKPELYFDCKTSHQWWQGTQYIRRNRETNKISYDMYVLLDDAMVVPYDFTWNSFGNIIENRQKTLIKIFTSFDLKEMVMLQRVCKEWNHIIKSLNASTASNIYVSV